MGQILKVRNDILQTMTSQDFLHNLRYFDGKYNSELNINIHIFKDNVLQETPIMITVIREENLKQVTKQNYVDVLTV